MVYENQPKNELLTELHRLQQEYIFLKDSSKKKIDELNLSIDLLQTKMLNCEAIFESSPVPMFIIDETTNIVMVNLAAVKLCGGTEEEILQHRPGNALRCVHSIKDPRGCGYSPDCKTCEVRNGIEALIAKGGTISGAELEFSLTQNGLPQKVWMNVGVEPLMKDGQKLWCIAMNDITQQKKTEHLLKESQTLLGSIIDSTNDMIWSVDAEHFGLLQWNASFHNYFLNDRGIEIGIGMTPKDLFPVDSEFIPFWTEVFNRTLEEGSYSLEYETFSRTRILQITLELLVQNGKTFGITVFAKNITAQKKAEIKLLKANRLYAVISQVNQAIVHIKEKDKLFKEICQIAIDFGKFQMAWIGLVDETTQLVKPHSVAGSEDGYLTAIRQIKATDTPEGRGPTGRCIREGKYIVCNDYAHDPELAIWRDEALKRHFYSSIALPIKQNRKIIGSFTLYGTSPDFFDDQEIRLLTEVADDISFALDTIEMEQKHHQAALALAKSEEQFRGIFNNLQDSFFQADLSGNFTIVSPSALRIFGYDSLEEMIGTPASNLYAKVDVRDQLLAELQSKGNINDFVYESKRKDGSTFWTSMNIRLIYQNGKVLGTEGIVRDISDRKQSEQKLFESQTLLKSIIDSTHDMIWSVDAQQFGLLNWNTSFHDYFINDRGIEIGIGMAPADLFPDGSEYIDFWKNLYTRTLAEGLLTIEYSTFSRTRVLNISLNLLKQEGKTFGISIFAKDITKQKFAEKALKEKEEEYRTLVENLSVGIVVHDENSAVILSNISADQILGLTNDQLKGRTAMDPNWNFIKEDYLVMPVEEYPVNIVLSTGKPLKSYLAGVYKSGQDKLSWVVCNGYPVFDQYGKIKNVVITFADITSRKVAEEELISAKKKIEESEYRLKLATASGKLGIWDWNLIENTMIWDDRMFELYGITHESFPNNIEAWTNGLHPEDKQRALDECNAALNGEKEYNTSFRVLQPDGTVLFLKANGSVLRDETGKPIRMIGINRDITENQLAAKQLLIEKEKAEESDRLKTAFLANMSHEIRTPLNSIIGFSELLNDPDFEPEQRTQFTKIIIENGNNLLVIISDIMDLSMLDARQIKIRNEKFTAKRLINDLANEHKTKAISKGIEFNSFYSNDVENVIINNDIYRIRQIFNNLIGNALKFTINGFIEIGYYADKSIVTFYVKDSGIGIAPEFHKDIFKRFRQVDETKTRKYGGNGLGLSISKNLVEVLGGKIWVESKVGKGSTFYFSLPINLE